MLQLNARCIEACDLPAVDENGTIDSYCRLKLGGQCFRTRTIDNSTVPKWRQDCTFTVTDFVTDFLLVTVYDVCTLWKDDPICDFEVRIWELAPGITLDRWFDASVRTKSSRLSRVHLLLHLAPVQSVPFVDYPFSVLLGHFRVVSFLTQASVDPMGFSVALTLLPAGIKRETAPLEKWSGVNWEEDFHYIVDDFDHSSLKIELISRARVVGEKTVQLSTLGGDRPRKDVFQVGNGNSIRLCAHFAPPNVPAFFNEDPDVYPLMSRIELHMRLIEAVGLKSEDFDGFSDPYVRLYLSGDKASARRTRKVIKTTNPRWNQRFQFDIQSLGNQKLKVKVFDWHSVGKDNKVASAQIELKTLQFGTPVDKWLPLTQGQLHVLYHLGKSGDRPFVTSAPIVPFLVGVQLVEATNVPKVDTIGKPDPFCKLKLSSDSVWVQSSPTSDTLYPIWDQDFRFIAVELSGTQLEVQLWDKNVMSNRLIGSGSVALMEHTVGVSDVDLTLGRASVIGQSANVHLYLQIVRLGQPLFENATFVHQPPAPRMKTSRKKKGLLPEQMVPFDEGLTLFVHVLTASEIRPMDLNGLSDPFVTLRLGDQKMETSVIQKTLNACWEDMFRFKVMSFTDDVLVLSLFDWDLVSRNDLIGTARVPMRDLVPGQSREFSWVLEPVVRGKQSGVLTVVLHLVCQGMFRFQSVPLVLDVVHVRLASLGKFSCKNDIFIDLQLANDRSWQNSPPKAPNEQKEWNTDFHFYLPPNIVAALNVRLISKGNTKDSVVSEGHVPLSRLTPGVPQNVVCRLKNKAEVSLFIEIAPDRAPYFTALPPPKESRVLTESISLYVRVLDAYDLPAMDINGKSDPYVTLRLRHRAERRQRTRIIKRSLAPTWNEDFRFPIRSLSTDILGLKLYDYDAIGRDDKIGSAELPVAGFRLGYVETIDVKFTPALTVSKAGGAHLLCHLLRPGGQPFVDEPFEVFRFHVRVCEAVDIPKVDALGLSDPYCCVGLSNSVKPPQTSVWKESLSPQWFQDFHFAVTSHENDFLEIVMKDEGAVRDRPISTLSLPVRSFDPLAVYDRWYDMTPVPGLDRGGKLRLVLQLAPVGTEPFEGPMVPEPPQPAAECVEVQVHLIEAEFLPVFRGVGFLNPFCRLSLVDQGLSKPQTSRQIDNSKHPRWNQSFRLQVFSLGQDILRVELMDHGTTCDSRLAVVDLPIAEMPFGVTTLAKVSPVATFPPSSYFANREGPLGIRLRYQVTRPWQVPFVDAPFGPYAVNLRIISVENTIGRAIFLAARLGNDIRPKLTSTRNTGTWNEDMRFLVLDYSRAQLQLEIHLNDVILAHTKLPLRPLALGKTQLLDVSFAGFVAHVAVQIGLLDAVPFADAGLPLQANDYMTLYVVVQKSDDIPPADANQMADPFLTLKLEKRKDMRTKTSVLKKTRNPRWNEEFQFRIQSYATDELKLHLCDYDAVRNDVIGQRVISIRDLPHGIVTEDAFQFGPATVFLRLHLAGRNQPKFVDSPFTLPVLHVGLLEATGLPPPSPLRVADPYARMGVGMDITFQRSTTFSSTSTPQWFETFTFRITDLLCDEFTVEVRDQDIKDSTLSTLTLKLTDFSYGYVYDQWFDLVPRNPGNGGRLRLKLQVANAGSEPLSGPPIPGPEPVLCETVQLHIWVFEAKNVSNCNSASVDPYCWISTIWHPELGQRSRVIVNSANPRWDQRFSLPVLSLLSDVCVIVVRDANPLLPDVTCGWQEVRLSGLQLGRLYKAELPLVWHEPTTGTITFWYQLTRIGEYAFEDSAPTEPESFGIYIDRLETSRPHVNTFVRVSLNDESLCVAQCTAESTASAWAETLRLLVCNRDCDIVRFTLLDRGQVVAAAQIGLAALFEIDAIPFGQGEILRVRAFAPCAAPSVALAPASETGHVLYVRVLDLRDSSLPGNWEQLFYCTVKLKNRPKSKQTGRTTKGFRNIVWNQIFTFPIRSLADDCLLIRFKADIAGQNPWLVEIERPVRDLPRGVPEELKARAPCGVGRAVAHVAAPGAPPFVERRFGSYQLNVLVTEGWDLRRANFMTQSDPYLRMRTTHDTAWQRTAAKRNTSTPQWFASFVFLLTDLEDDFLVQLIDDNAIMDRLIAQVLLPLSGLSISVTTAQVCEFAPNPAKARLLLQITPEGAVAFEDYAAPEERVVRDEMAVHLKVGSARGLLAKDWYCAVQFDGTREVWRTRTIVNTPAPVWDQQFHLPVRSLETGVLCVAVYNRDIVTRDNLLGTVRLELARLPPGDIVAADYPVGETGQISLTAQLAGPGTPSWVARPFVPARLLLDVEAADLRGDGHFLALALAADAFPRFSLFGRSPRERFGFLLADPAGDVLRVAVWEHSPKGADAQRAAFEVPVAALAAGEVERDGVRLRPASGPLHGLPIAEGHCCAVEIRGSFAGVGGSYVRCALAKRRQARLSRIAWPGRDWESPIALDLPSANGEVLKFTLVRHRPTKKDKKVGKGALALEDVGFGIVCQRTLRLRPYPPKIGHRAITTPMELSLSVHIVAPLAQPFVAAPFVPARLRVVVIEAINVPRMDIGSKSDPYCMVKLDADVAWKSTAVIDNTLTPQWCEALDLWVLDRSGSDLVLNVAIWDKNVKWNRLMGEQKVTFVGLGPGVAVDGWYDLPGAAPGIKINLTVQLIVSGDVAIEAPQCVGKPVPKELLLPRKGDGK
jgi:Ca2+-dependent lipid-binding protein